MTIETFSKIVATPETTILRVARIVEIRPRPVVGTITKTTTEVTITKPTTTGSITTITEITIQIIKTRKTIIDDRTIRVKSIDRTRAATTTIEQSRLTTTVQGVMSIPTKRHVGYYFIISFTFLRENQF